MRSYAHWQCRRFECQGHICEFVDFGERKTTRDLQYVRDLDVASDLFLVVDDPLVPAMAAVGHAAQNNFGDFEARLSQAHYE